MVKFKWDTASLGPQISTLHVCRVLSQLGGALPFHPFQGSLLGLSADQGSPTTTWGPWVPIFMVKAPGRGHNTHISDSLHLHGCPRP